jgi:hypothetical protein
MFAHSISLQIRVEMGPMLASFKQPEALRYLFYHGMLSDISIT